MTGSLDNATNLLSSDPIRYFDSIGVTVFPTKILFPVGTSGSYMITMTITGTAALLVDPTILLTGCSYLSLFDNDTNNRTSNEISTSKTYITSFIIDKTDSSIFASVIFSGGTYPSSGSGFNGDIFITSLPLGLTV